MVSVTIPFTAGISVCLAKFEKHTGTELMKSKILKEWNLFYLRLLYRRILPEICSSKRIVGVLLSLKINVMYIVKVAKKNG